MRTSILLARTCARQLPHNPRPHILRQTVRNFSWSRPRQNPSYLDHARAFFHKPPPPIKGGKPYLLAALTPAAFVELSEDESDGEETGEERMLHASRAELAEYVPERLRGSRTVRRSIWKFLDTWVVEPLATGFRFLHLLIIFVPVIATVPIVWLGQRQKDRDGERSGTLWWYGFLVHSMERAGAAFIKVGMGNDFSTTTMASTDSWQAWTMGCI